MDKKTLFELAQHYELWMWNFDPLSESARKAKLDFDRIVELNFRKDCENIQSLSLRDYRRKAISSCRKIIAKS